MNFLNIRSLSMRHQVIRFVLLFVGRTGSTFLIKMLNSHPEILAVGEKLVDCKDNGSTAQIYWAERFLTPPLITRHSARGFKTKLVDVLSPDDFATLLKRMGCKIIYLSRRNRIKAVVSRLNGERVWETYRRWNLHHQSERLPPFEIDPLKFDDYLKHREKVEVDLYQFVNGLGLPTLSICYEDLSMDSNRTLLQVFSFLRVGTSPVEVVTKKNTHDNLREVILNFDEVRANYVNTKYEQMFDEVLI